MFDLTSTENENFGPVSQSFCLNSEPGMLTYARLEPESLRKQITSGFVATVSRYASCMYIQNTSSFEFLQEVFCIYNMEFSEVGRTIKNLFHFIVRELD